MPVFAVFAALVGAIQCWAVQEPSGTPAPTAPITAEQRAQTRALLIDAMLDPADIPAGLAERSIGREEGHPPNLQAYLDNGWLMFVTNAWIGNTDAFFAQEAVYAFENEAGATAYASKLAADMATAPGATGMPDPPASAAAYERTFTAVDGRGHRVIEFASRVGRLIVSIDLQLASERGDWREVANALLSAAEQRAQEALTAAGG